MWSPHLTCVRPCSAAAGALALGLTKPKAPAAGSSADGTVGVGSGRTAAPAPAAAAAPAPGSGKPRGKVSKIIKLTPEQFAQLTGACAGRQTPRPGSPSEFLTERSGNHVSVRSPVCISADFSLSPSPFAPNGQLVHAAMPFGSSITASAGEPLFTLHQIFGWI